MKEIGCVLAEGRKGKRLISNSAEEVIMEKYLTIEELSRILQVKKHYIYALTSQRKIPFLKLGRFLRFERDKIEEWLKDKAQKPEDIEKIKASVF
jgi:excisionase family DNA binding protein